MLVPPKVSPLVADATHAAKMSELETTIEHLRARIRDQESMMAEGQAKHDVLLANTKTLVQGESPVVTSPAALTVTPPSGPRAESPSNGRTRSRSRERLEKERLLAQTQGVSKRH